MFAQSLRSMLLGTLLFLPLTAQAAEPHSSKKTVKTQPHKACVVRKHHSCPKQKVPAVSQGVYHPTLYTLDNGLQIVVVPNHRAPVVHSMLWYKVGAMDEPAGQSGLAHYLEHLMFKGTPQTPAGEFSKKIAAVGGRDNAFTSYDYTAYFATVPADFMLQLLAMEADRMRHLALTEDVAKPELDVVLAERRQRTDDNPQGRFAEKMQQAIYGAHPYGRPVIGWRAEIEQMTAKTATDFYRQWYAPNNAVLVVSGDVEPAQVMHTAAATFGTIPAQPLPQREKTKSLYKPHQNPETLLVADADVLQPTLQRVYRAPSYQEATGKTAYALQVLAQILDGGSVGRLYQNLVVQKGLATETEASYDPLARDLGRFSFGIALRPRVTIAQTTAALDAVLQRLVQKGVSQDEVTRAIKRLREQAIFTRDQLVTPGYAFGQALSSGLTVADVEQWPDRIAAVTVADVNQAARTLFASKDYVTGTLVPDGKHNGSTVRKPTMPEGDIR